MNGIAPLSCTGVAGSLIGRFQRQGIDLRRIVELSPLPVEILYREQIVGDRGRRDIALAPA
jgi:hypothetical protein